jgi:GTP-binding protein EngB required for normal cell division/deoxyadenosine/deoxycytidine kinase
MGENSVRILSGKKSIDCIDKLREFGLTRYISLPQIAVLGDQSSGKSSVLESISGIKFPRSSGLCTRFPTAIQMRNASVFKAKLRLIPGRRSSDKRSAEFDMFMEENMDEIKSIDDIGNAIATAKSFICAEDDFSDDILSIEMDGPACIPVTLVDLPGYVKTSIGDQKKTVKDQIKAMCSSYLNDKRTIILAVIPANIDLANNEIFENASEVDPDGDRTIGVITKPDMMDAGTEHEIIDLVNNGTKKRLDLGYYIVRNRNNIDLINNISNTEARDNEQAFFMQPPWNQIRSSNTGADNLSAYLSEILERHVMRELPNVQLQLNDMIRENRRVLAEMGPEMVHVSEMRIVYNRIIDDFQLFFSELVDGVYTNMADLANDDTVKLRALIRKRSDAFYDELEKVDIDAGSVHIQSLITANRGRELPGMSTDKIFVAVFQKSIRPWEKIIQKFVDGCYDDVLQIAKRVFEAIVLHKNPKIHIFMSGKLVEFIEKLHEKSSKKASIMFHTESHYPATYNHYYSDNIEKIRQDRVIEISNAAAGVTANGHLARTPEITIRANQCKSNLEYEIQDIQDCVTAYYKVARKRVADNIPMHVVETELMQHLHQIKNELLSINDVVLTNLMLEAPAQQRKRQDTKKSIQVLEKSREYLISM